MIAQAVEILRHGGLVAFPTETVYGLGADATNAAAVRKVFTAKSRPAGNPLIVHVTDAQMARQYSGEWPAEAEALAAKFWPGAITLVTARGAAIPEVVTGGGKSAAIRSPDHPMAQELLRAFGLPIVGPSANRSTRVSPTTAEHVRRELGDRVDLILDGGPCHVGIESTVIDLTHPPARILRLGAISREMIEQCIGPVESAIEHREPDAFNRADPHHPAMSPGQQAVHYSPMTRAFRFDGLGMKFLERASKNIVVIYRRGSELEHAIRQIMATKIEMPEHADGYARRLYAAIHEADQQGADAIWIEIPPQGTAWEAVRDRIRRATRPAEMAEGGEG